MPSLAERFSEYRVMWLMVFFDMPTETKTQRKAYADFRKKLLVDGFTMFQFSLYIRHCPSWESAEVHRKRVQAIIPQWGMIGVLCVTDKQFAKMEIYRGVKRPQAPPPTMQLELF